MSVKYKSILIIGIIFILLLLGQIAIHRFVIIPGYEGIEKRHAVSGAKSVVEAIKNETNHLGSLCEDWAGWDDTYFFMKDKNQRYINRNILAASFETMKINHFYLFDLKGRLVLGRNYDLASGKFERSSGISDDFFKRKNLLAVSIRDGKIEKKDKISGIFLTEKYPVLIAARPVLTSEFRGPARGTLVMGRVMDERMMKRLYSITNIKFSIYHVNPVAMNDRLRSVILILAADSSREIYIESEGKDVKAYTTFVDIGSNEIFLVEAFIPRLITQKEIESMRFSLLFTLLLGFILITVIFLSFQKTILTPVSELNTGMRVIMDSRDLTLRVKNFGRNEFGFLSLTFNELISQLQKTQNRLIDQIQDINNEVSERKKAEEQLRIANEKLATLASIDELTGLSNRRKFDEKFREALLLNRRNSATLTILMCDVDYFKNYNDHYGHLLGDECLHAIATALSQVVHRPGDLVARYGGEEFIVMLPQTDLVGSEFVIESMLGAVRELGIEHEKSLVADHVTISIGAAVLSSEGELSGEMIIAEADKALYKAKQNGRNRSVIYEL